MCGGNQAAESAKIPAANNSRFHFQICSICFAASAEHKNRTAAVKNISEGVGIFTMVIRRIRLWKGFLWFKSTWLHSPAKMNNAA